jgi:aminopeptidase
MSVPGPHVSERSALVRALAELIISPTGVNLQPQQVVGITAECGHEEIWRAVAEAAYARGARFVDPWIFDQHVKRSRLRHADQDTLSYKPPWLGERYTLLGAMHGANIRLTGPVAPTLFDDIESERLGHDMLPRMPESTAVTHKGLWNWIVAPAPNQEWANLLFGDLEPEAALDRLWEQIGHIMRLDEPVPQQAWGVRLARLKAVSSKLNDLRLDSLHFVGPGTDLQIGLMSTSVWTATGGENVDGVKFTPNLPTEEVYTAPDPRRVNGHVAATKPLVVGGGFVSGLRVRFEEGRAVSAEAERGAGLVNTMIDKDEGAARLGEVALVDGDSRIGQLGTVFYETLLDENSASHIAFGAAYPDTVASDLDRERINQSQIHIDFMIGSEEVDVSGRLADGTEVPLLRSGQWQIGV